MEAQRNGVDALLETIARDVIEYCSVKGLLMKSSPLTEDCEYSHLPVSLFPTPYPLSHYQEAIRLQPALATMVATLVKQPSLIHEVLKYFQEHDPFLKRLVDLSKHYNSQPHKQDLHLLILRSDYMLDTVTDSLKLVEYNTIAAALSVHS